MDISDELVKIMSEQIRIELDKEIMQDIRRSALIEKLKDGTITNIEAVELVVNEL